MLEARHWAGGGGGGGGDVRVEPRLLGGAAAAPRIDTTLRRPLPEDRRRRVRDSDVTGSSGGGGGQGKGRDWTLGYSGDAGHRWAVYRVEVVTGRDGNGSGAWLFSLSMEP